MCFETIGRVTSLPADEPGIAFVDTGGSTRRINLVVLATEGIEVTVGDWLRTHTGLAVAKLLESEAAPLIAERRRMQVAADVDDDITDDGKHGGSLAGTSPHPGATP